MAAVNKEEDNKEAMSPPQQPVSRPFIPELLTTLTDGEDHPLPDASMAVAPTAVGQPPEGDYLDQKDKVPPLAGPFPIHSIYSPPASGKLTISSIAF